MVAVTRGLATAAWRWLDRVLRAALIASLVSGPIAAQVTPGGQHAPTLDMAANGTPVVKINAANGAGVSHNTYDRFDVEKRGLILNNSAEITTTKLAGYVDGNRNIKQSGPAHLILNEVVSGAPSRLAGYVEVAGTPAQVVIANAQGISCAGCGFINAPQVTLTSGQPFWSPGGAVTGYAVERGAVTIEGAGMDARDAQVGLFARAVAINAGIWADRVAVSGGAADVMLATDGVTNAVATARALPAGAKPPPTLAIDVAALGGMYARSVRLIGTEAGLGVRVDGTLASLEQGYMVSSAGDLLVGGTAKAHGQATLLAAGDTRLTGTVYGGDGVTLGAGCTLTNTGLVGSGAEVTMLAPRIVTSGTVAAGLRADGTFGSTGDVHVAAARDAVLGGQIDAPGRLALDADRLALSGMLSAGSAQLRAATIEQAATGQLSLRRALDVAGQRLDLAGAITADSVSATGDTLAEHGSWRAAGAMRLTLSDRLDNDGTIAAGGAMALTAGAIDNTGALLNTGKLLRLDARGDIAGKGMIAGQGAVALAAGSLDLTGGTLRAGDALDVGVTGALAAGAGGTIAAGGAATISGGAVDLAGATLTADRIALTADTLSLAGGQIAASGAAASKIAVRGLLDGDGGTIRLNAGDAAISAGALSLAHGTIAHAGTGALTLDVAGALAAPDATIASAGTLALGAGDVAADGATISGASALALEAGAVSARGATLASGGAMTLRLDALDLGEGTLRAGTLAARVAGDWAGAHGTIAVTGAAQVAAGAIDWSGAAVSADTLGLDAAALTLAGGQLGTSGSGEARLAVTGVLDNTGGAILLGGQDAAITAGALDNVGGAIAHAGAGTLSLHVGDTLDMRAGLIASGGALMLDADRLAAAAGTIDGATGMAITARDVAAHGATLRSGGAGIVRSASLDLGEGVVRVAGPLDVAVDGLWQAAASVIAAGGAATLRAGKLDLAGATLEAGALALDAGALRLDAAQLITAGAGDDRIAVDGTLRGVGAALRLGGEKATVDAGALALADATIDHAGTGQLGLSAAGGLDLTRARVTSDGTLSLNAGSIAADRAVLGGATGLTIAARGAIGATQAQLVSGGALALDAGSITAPAAVLAGATGLTLRADVLAAPGATLVSAGAMELDVGALDLGAGRLSADRLTLDAGTAGLADATLVTTGSAPSALTVNGLLDLRGGTVQLAGDDATIRAGALDARAGVIDHRGAGTLAIGVAGGLASDDATIASAGRLAIRASAVSATGATLVGGAALTLATGALAADGSTLGVSGAGPLRLDVAEGLSARGATLVSGGALVAQAAALDLTAAHVAARGGALALGAFATAGEGAGMLRLGGATLTGADTVDLVATHIIDADGAALAGTAAMTLRAGDAIGAREATLQSGGDLGLFAGSAIDATAATLRAGGTLAVAAPRVTLDRADIGAAALDVAAGSLALGRARVAVTGALALASDGTIDLGGTLLRGDGRDMSVRARRLITAGGQLLHGGDGTLSVTVGEALDDSAGLIAGAGDVAVRGGDLALAGGTISARRDLALDAGDAAIGAAGGRLLAGGALALSGGALDLTGGTIAAGDTIDARLGALTGAKARIESSGGAVALAVARGLALSGGTIAAARELGLGADGFALDGATLGAGTTLAIDAGAGGVDARGATLAAPALRLVSAGDVALGDGRIGATRLDITARSLTSDGAIVARDAGVITTDAMLHNTGLIEASAGTLAIRAGALDQRGAIAALGGGLTLAVGGALDQAADAVITARDTLDLAAGTLTNKGELSGTRVVARVDGAASNAGLIAGRAGVELDAGALVNDGAIAAANDAAAALHVAHALGGRGVIQAGDVTIEAGTVGLTGGTLAAAHGLAIGARDGDLVLSGTAVGAGEALSLTARDTLRADGGARISAPSTTLGARAVTLDHALLTTDRLALDATDLGVVDGAALLVASTDTLRLRLAGTLDLSGGRFETDAATLDLNAGRLVNDGGALLHHGDALTLQADTVANGGALLTEGRLALTARRVSNAGTIGAAAAAALAVSEALDNRGTIVSGGALTVGGTIDADGVAGGALALTGDGRWSGRGGVTIAGASAVLDGATIVAGSEVPGDAAALTLTTSGGLSATSARLSATGDLALAGGAVDLTRAIAAARGALRVDSGAALVTDTATLDGATLALSAGDLTNRGGTLLGRGGVAVTARGTLLTTGVIQANAGDLALHAGALDNDGAIGVVGPGALSLTVDGGLTDRAAGLIAGGGRIDARAGSLANAGRISAGGALALAIDGDAANDGKLLAGGALTLTATTLANAGTIAALGADPLGLTVTRGLTSGGTIAGGGVVTLDAGAIAFNGGMVSAGTDLAITARAQGIDVGATTVAGGHALALGSAAAITAHDKVQLVTAGAATVSAPALKLDDATLAADTLALTTHDLSVTHGARLLVSGTAPLALDLAGTLDLSGGALETNAGDLSVHAASLVNDGGRLAHHGRGALTLAVAAIDNRGTVTTAGALGLTATTLDNGGTLAAARDATLLVSDRASDTGTIASGGALTLRGSSDGDGTGALALSGGGIVSGATGVTIAARAASLDGARLFAGRADADAPADLSLTVTDALRGEEATVAATGSARLRGASVDLASAQLGARTLDIAATSGDLSLTGATAQAPTLALAATGAIDARKATLRADALTLGAATLDSSEGTIATSTLAATLGALTNRRGTITVAAADPLALTLTGALDNRGGTIATGASDLSLHAATIDDTGGTIIHAGTGALTLVSDGAFGNNGGTIRSNGSYSLIATGLDNDDGTIAGAAGVLRLRDKLSNVGGNVLAAGALDIDPAVIDNRAGKIAGGGPVTLTGGTLDNRGGRILGGDTLNVALTGALDNRGGTIAATGAAQIGAGALSNAKGLVHAGGDLSLTIASIDNGGEVSAGGLLDAKVSGAISNGNGVILADRVTLAAASLSNAGGKVIGASLLTVTTRGAITNTSGELGGAGTVTLASTSLRNGGHIAADDLTISAKPLAGVSDRDAGIVRNDKDGVIWAEGHGSVTATTVNNAGSIAAGSQLRLDATTIDNAAGTLGAGDRLDLRFTSAALGKLVATNDLALTTSGGWNNAAGQTISAGRNLFLTVHGDVTNAGTIQAEGVATVSADGALANASGGIVRARGLDLSAGGVLSNDGLISGGTVSLTADRIENTAHIYGDDLLLVTRSTVHSEPDTSAGALAGGPVGAGAIRNIGDKAVIATRSGSLTLVTPGGVVNGDGALIHSAKDMIIAGKVPGGDGDWGKAATLTNSSATIEAVGDISIMADKVFNVRTSFELLSDTKETVTVSASKDKKRVKTTTTTDIETQSYNASAASTITAKNVTIKGSYLANWISSIISSGALQAFSVGAQDIRSRDIDRITTTKVHKINEIRHCKGIVITCHTWIIDDPANESTTSDKTTELLERLGAPTVGLTSVTMVAGTIENLVVGASPGAAAAYAAKVKADSSAPAVPADTPTSATAPTHDPSAAASARAIAPAADEVVSVATGTTGTHEALVTTDARDEVPIVGALALARPERAARSTSVAAAAVGSPRVVAAASLGAPAAPLAVAATAVGGGTLAISAGRDISVGTLATPRRADARPDTTPSLAHVDRTGFDVGALPGAVARALPPADADAGVALAPVGAASRFAAPPLDAGAAPHALSGLPPSVAALLDGAVGARDRAATPGLNYLIERDPAYTDKRNFLSSDYFLQRLHYDPSRVGQRLGDGAYEQALVVRELRALTGEGPIGDDEAERRYRELMDAGAEYAEAYHLVPGVALSAEQMAALTTDIVLLVETEVAGPDGPRRVLAPVVYLAHTHADDLDHAGKLRAGGDLLRVRTADELAPTGTLPTSVAALYTDAETVERVAPVTLPAGAAMGGISSGGTMTLITTGALVNQGMISAVDGSVIHAGTDLTNSGVIDGGKVASISAVHDVIGTGGAFKGGDVALFAGHDMLLDPAASTRHVATAYGDGIATTQSGSSVTATGTLTVSAGHDMVARGADFSAGGPATIVAGHDIDLGASVDRTQLSESGYSRHGRWSRTSDQETANGTSVTAGGKVTIAAGLTDKSGTLSVEGGTIGSRSDDVALFGAGGVAIVEARERGTSSEDKTRRGGGLFSSSRATSHVERSTDMAVDSVLAGRHVTIGSSDGSVLLRGVQAGALDSIQIFAQSDVAVVASEDRVHAEGSSSRRKSGLSLGGDGLFLGSAASRQRWGSDTVTHNGAALVSRTGNVQVDAGEKLTVSGSTIHGADTSVLSGKTTTIEGVADTRTRWGDRRDSSSGLRLGAYEHLSGAIDSVAGLPGRVGRGAAGGLGQGVVTTASEALRTTRSLMTAATDAVGVSASLGSTHSGSREDARESHDVGASVTGAHVVVEAREGDLTVTGSTVRGTESESLSTARDLVLRSGQDSGERTGSSWSNGYSLGLRVGVGLAGATSADATLGTRASRSQSGERSVRQVDSVIDGGAHLTLHVGRDALVQGAQVGATDMDLSIARDLVIASPQDSRTQWSRTTSGGVSAGESNTGPTLSVDVAGARRSGEWRAVNAPSGIVSRGGAVAGTVDGTIRLTGGVLAATDGAGHDNGELRLTTGGLVTGDVVSGSWSRGGSLGVAGSANAPTRRGEAGGGVPTLDASVMSSERVEVMRATLGHGAVTVRDDPAGAALAGVNRDVARTQAVRRDTRSGLTLDLDVGAARELAAVVRGNTAHSVLGSTGAAVARDPLALPRAAVEEVHALSDGAAGTGALDALLRRLTLDVVGQKAIARGDAARAVRDYGGAPGEDRTAAGVRARREARILAEAARRGEDVTALAAQLDDVRSPLGQALSADAAWIVFARDHPEASGPEALIAASAADARRGATRTDGSGEVAVAGKTTLGTRAADAVVEASAYLNEHPVVRDAFAYGRALLAGGPAGVVVNYAVDQGVSEALRRTGLGERLGDAMTTVGGYEYGLLRDGSLPAVATVDELTAGGADRSYARDLTSGTIDLLGVGGGGIGLGIKKLDGVVGRSERELGGAAKDAERSAETVDDPKLLEGFEGTAASRRYGRGVASYGNLPRIQKGERWLRGSERNAAKVPLQVAEKLAGQSFRNFDEFRQKFWMTVADDPVLVKEFSSIDVFQMRNGNAPSVKHSQALGGRLKYELDHNIEIKGGGNVYDMDNIIVRSPLNHVKGKANL
ncbi:hemagglutinin repeat-containing protein [Sphingomonas sp. RHCKR7]|uniref:two-partner secretion domain-containing protein n=1 Tax=Sphingomonas folli TaxID=2862497 RepID=UPI001CA5782C|nr:hemagglutinin repeat-containing protein [Sphingomonas folli]MBW6525827.1 hemagglutinin repeat-containing protein [Sphingomonas folli]